MPQGSVHWQGTQRRACGPGAHWNVQVVRGKVTTRCLWHACKALGIGLLLMLLGACMATIGYYADQLSVAQEIRGNMTVKVKNESRGFHLNNLSYAGPIVMGVGGFIVVAACVITFEARDSAAKVVPARFRFAQNSTAKKGAKSQRSRRSTSCQTGKWDHQLGLFRANRTPSPGGCAHEVSRKRLTAEFLHFSKTLHDRGAARPLRKSPSAPSLVEKRSSRRRAPRHAGCALLNPELLQRHALSVDNPSYSPPRTSRESLEHRKLSGSQVSMAMDLHIPNEGPVTLRIQDRSDTARRHQLLRQTKVEDEETKPQCYSRYPDDFLPRKRNSMDQRALGELAHKRTSPKDFRKVSSPNFRKTSLERIAGERRLERQLGQRKASLDFRRSPDARRADYRKYSIERFAADCAGYLEEPRGEFRSRANTGESVGRRQRRPKLYHSRSDDNRRRSFDRNRRESQSSRFSLNTQVVPESWAPEYELKYFTGGGSLDTEESRGDNSDDSRHAMEMDEAGVAPAPEVAAGAAAETNALLEEPELEKLTEIDDSEGESRGACGGERIVRSTTVVIEADEERKTLVRTRREQGYTALAMDDDR